MAHTNKDDFTSKFDLGFPIDPADNNADRDVLILYSKWDAVPTKMKVHETKKTIDFFTAEDATENCDFMHVLTRNKGGNKRTCLALVPNYEGYHIQSWARMPEKGALSKELPLRLIPRSVHPEDGQDDFGVPTQQDTEKTWKALTQYFTTYKMVVADLEKIVDTIKIDNTVIVCC
jgi:hypothetical protein